MLKKWIVAFSFILFIPQAYSASAAWNRARVAVSRFGATARHTMQGIGETAGNWRTVLIRRQPTAAPIPAEMPAPRVQNPPSHGSTPAQQARMRFQPVVRTVPAHVTAGVIGLQEVLDDIAEQTRRAEQEARNRAALRERTRQALIIPTERSDDESETSESESEDEQPEEITPTPLAQTTEENGSPTDTDRTTDETGTEGNDDNDDEEDQDTGRQPNDLEDYSRTMGQIFLGEDDDTPVVQSQPETIYVAPTEEHPAPEVQESPAAPAAQESTITQATTIAKNAVIVAGGAAAAGLATLHPQGRQALRRAAPVARRFVQTAAQNVRRAPTVTPHSHVGTSGRASILTQPTVPPRPNTTVTKSATPARSSIMKTIPRKPAPGPRLRKVVQNHATQPTVPPRPNTTVTKPATPARPSIIKTIPRTPAPKKPLRRITQDPTTQPTLQPRSNTTATKPAIPARSSNIRKFPKEKKSTTPRYKRVVRENPAPNHTQGRGGNGFGGLFGTGLRGVLENQSLLRPFAVTPRILNHGNRNHAPENRENPAPQFPPMGPIMRIEEKPEAPEVTRQPLQPQPQEQPAPAAENKEQKDESTEQNMDTKEREEESNEYGTPDTEEKNSGIWPPTKEKAEEPVLIQPEETVVPKASAQPTVNPQQENTEPTKESIDKTVQVLEAPFKGSENTGIKTTDSQGTTKLKTVCSSVTNNDTRVQPEMRLFTPKPSGQLYKKQERKGLIKKKVHEVTSNQTESTNRSIFDIIGDLFISFFKLIQTFVQPLLFWL